MQPCPDPGGLPIAQPSPAEPAPAQAGVIPDPQPISCGSISQGMPLFSTKMMPVSAARFGSGRRPPFGFGRSGGNSGSISIHNPSGTRGLAMPPRTPPSYRRSQFC